MKYHLFICLFVVFVTIGGANTEQIDANTLAEKYLIVTKQRQMNEKMLEMVQIQMSQNIDSAIREQNPKDAQRDLAKRYASEMSNVIIDELKWEKIKYSYIEVVREIYSDEELQELIKFFQTDLGKLYIEKDQSMKMKLGKVSQSYMKRLMLRIRQLEAKMEAELDIN
ncbi:MAG: DUF2059 domain-containing protein [Desulfobacterales bacterium]